jgi:hypothetical protein
VILGAHVILYSTDVEATAAEPAGRGVPVEGGVSDQGWGRLTTIRLPGGGTLGLYEARHATAVDL